MAIKVYRSTDTGAPSLTGQAGAMITVLDAVLVNGYNTVNITSINRSGTTATVVCAAAHGLTTNDSALIAGAVQTDYNIDAVVTVIDSVTFTYQVANSPTTPATGTITVKRAPAGFTKIYAATNKGAYKSNDVTGNRLILRCDDTAGTTAGEARMYAYETMSSVDVGTGVTPSAVQSANGYFWRKSSTTDGTARAWMIVTDGKTVYYFCEYNLAAASNMSAPTFSGAFGDILSYKAGDAYGVVLTGCTTTASTVSPPNGLFKANTTITSVTSFASSIAIVRDFTAVAGSRYVGLMGSALNTVVGGAVYLTYPHLVDSGYYVSPIIITQGVPSLIRGRLPGAYEGWHGRTFNHGDLVTDIQGLTGRTLMHIYGQDSATTGCLLLDITGPWDS